MYWHFHSWASPGAGRGFLPAPTAGTVTTHATRTPPANAQIGLVIGPSPLRNASAAERPRSAARPASGCFEVPEPTAGWVCRSGRFDLLPGYEGKDDVGEPV